MSRNPTAPSPLPGAASPLRAHWQSLGPREKNLVGAATALVALALLWWLALAPALQTLRTAPARHATLDAQLQHMQSLQAEARQLQGTPRANPDNALRALQTSVTENLGAAARLNVAGDRATLALKGVPAQTLAPWLAQARSNAKSVPQEAHLVRSNSNTNGTPLANDGTPARWDGTLVLALPPR